MALVNMDNFKRSIIVGEESLKIINNVNVNNVNNSQSWWYPSKTGNKRILFCGTYPIGTSNGYSKVVYYISKFLGLKEDIDLTIYGFQNFNQTLGASIRNDIPSRVKLHDAFATEDPKRNGFGEKEIGDFIKKILKML